MVTPRSLAFVAAVIFWAAPVLAQDEAMVRVGGSCVPPGTSLEETLRILRAELSPMHVESLDSVTAPSTDDVIVGIQACTLEPPSARLTIWTHGRSRERGVNLGDASPDARDRMLALAIAEATREAPSIAAGSSNEDVPVFAPVPATPASASPNAPAAPPPAFPGARSPDSAPHAADAATAGGSSAMPLAGVLVRFVVSPSTYLVGAELGVAWRRAGLGILGLGTERSTSLGTATLFALAASPWLDVIPITPDISVRLAGELGISAASGTPIGPATATPSNAPHVAIEGGVAAGVPLGGGWVLDSALYGGYASSLTIQAGGRDVAGLAGAFVSWTLGTRVPFAP